MVAAAPATPRHHATTPPNKRRLTSPVRVLQYAYTAYPLPIATPLFMWGKGEVVGMWEGEKEGHV